MLPRIHCEVKKKKNPNKLKTSMYVMSTLLEIENCKNMNHIVKSDAIMVTGRGGMRGG